MNTKTKIIIAAMIAISVGLSACNDSKKKKKSQTPEPEVPEQTILNVDASDYDNYVFYNLETMSQVNVADAKSSTEWHIGFRRSGIILNGGDSGPGNVEGALAAENTDFYDGNGEPIYSAFLNATADNQIAHFDAAIPGSEVTQYIADENALAIDGNSVAMAGPITHWYEYNIGTHQVSANDASLWIIRSAGGDSFAKFHVTDLTQNGRVIDDISFEFNYQGSEDANFSASATAVNALDLSSGAVCYDIDAPGTADCSGSAWDLRFDPGLEIYVNSGIYGGASGAAFGPLVAAEVSDPPVSNNGNNVPRWALDGTSGIFDEESWYAYNLEGNHKLWSNFNVYAIDTDSTNPDSLKIKAQIHSYYSNEGASGFLTIRTAEF